jgi:hypothetical protein
MSETPPSWANWLVPHLTLSQQFDLQIARNNIPKLSREQLEAELSKALELLLIHSSQLRRGIKAVADLQAELAAAEPVQGDPLKQWLSMAREIPPPG